MSLRAKATWETYDGRVFLNLHEEDTDMTYSNRYTIETLTSGQPRPYADHEHLRRVTFEWKIRGDTEFKPQYIDEELAKFRLDRMPCGFITRRRNDPDWKWPDSYLKEFKAIDPKRADEVIPYGDPDQVVAATWEFLIISPCTD